MPVATNFDPLFRLDHYGNHGSDFSVIDAYDYESQARDFLNKPLVSGGDIEECTRSNGETVRYDKNTNEFAVVRANGIIKTYFKPMMYSAAPPGTPRDKTHKRTSNYQYFLDECAR